MRYFDQNRFFRVVPGFVAQFGVHKDYDIHDRWRKYFILADPPKEKNLRGTLAFAQSEAQPHPQPTEMPVYGWCAMTLWAMFVARALPTQMATIS
jgi:hypothetical protein